MHRHLPLLPALAAAALVAPATGAPAATPTLREAYADHFLIGAALNRAIVSGTDRAAADLAARQFSSVTSENDMKWQSIHPAPGRYAFDAADACVEFARKHRMAVIGHTLVWHSQTPAWVFQGEDGAPPTREVLLERMRDHIRTVAGRYKGRVKGWDVVNEAIADGGPGPLRDSPWRRIIGEDFIDHAFRAAREADPDAELYYNDYGIENERKRQHTVAVLRGLLDRGVPIDGVGIQGHYGIEHPPAAVVEQTIKDFAALGLKVMITELDVDVLPARGPAGNADVGRRERGGAAANPYTEGLPDEIQQKLARRYADLFEVFLRHRKSVTRVTFWGLDDGHSWLNHFPVRGRTNHPLLFDRQLNPKPAFTAVLQQAAKTR